MSTNISFQLEGKVGMITVDDGKVNAFSHSLIKAFNEVLDQVESSSADALLITGRQGILSGGFDLKVMHESPEARIEMGKAGARLLLRLLELPIPIVVASTGHAIALGAFLLLAADYRIGVEGDYKMGLNEMAIGIPIPLWGVEMCKTNIARPFYLRAILNAELFNPQNALQAGFLNEVVSEKDLLDAAYRKAEAFTKLDGIAYKETKKLTRQAEIEAFRAAL